MAKKVLLECRAMTWEENVEYNEFSDSLAKNKVSGKEYLSKIVPWVMEHVYGVKDINSFSPGELMAIYTTTVSLTSNIRTDEIKNLKTSTNGSVSEANIVKTRRLREITKQPLDCETCKYRPPELMEGNREAMMAWYLIRNCKRCAIGIGGAVPQGVDWQSASYIFDRYKIRVSELLMEKLQKLEDIEIQAFIEKTRKENPVRKGVVRSG